MKKILLISYHFPPSPAVGGTRMANFAKALPSYGFEPVVLTVKEKFIENPDAGRLRGLESIKIFRAGKLPKLINIYPFLKKLISKERFPFESGATHQLAGPPAGSSRERLLSRLRRYLKSFAFLPDVESNWILPGFIKALSLIKDLKPDCILTSCPPHSAHVLGLILKTFTGVKWVTDFRDPWLIRGKKRLFPTCAMSLKLDRWLEKTTAKKADMILFNTPNLRDVYRERYSTLPEDKFVFLPNGYDGEFFSRFRATEKFSKFTISYAGSMYLGRTPEPVFAALRALIDEGKLRADQAAMKIFGECRTIGGRPAAQVIDSYGLSKVVELCGSVSYLDATEAIAKSHLALLLAMNQPYQLPGKVYDYMGAGTKVLAVTDGGATVDFLRTTGAGAAFSPADTDGIKDFIYAEFKGAGWGGSSAIKNLDAKHIAGELAGRLRSMLSCEIAPEGSGGISLPKPKKERV